MKFILHGTVKAQNEVEQHWLSFDLDNLPLGLEKIFRFIAERNGSWSYFDDLIYWVGGELKPPPFGLVYQKILMERKPQNHQYIDCAGKLQYIYDEEISNQALHIYDDMTRSPPISKKLFVFVEGPDFFTCHAAQRKIPRGKPFSFWLNGKLHVIGGRRSFVMERFERDERGPHPDPMPNWSFWGESFDLRSCSWTPIARFSLSDYRCDTAALMGNDVVVFNNPDYGILSLYHVPSDDDMAQLFIPEFNLSQHSVAYPLPGLEGCSGFTVAHLLEVVRSVPPMIEGGILYWITSNFQIFGFDFNKREWWVSKPIDRSKLGKGLYPFEEELPSPRRSLLLDLRDGRFLLIIKERDVLVGKVRIALIHVLKEEPRTLWVVVEKIYAFEDVLNFHLQSAILVV